MTSFLVLNHVPPHPICASPIHLAELVFHHLLLPRDPRDIEGDGHHQEGRTRDPVLEQEEEEEEKLSCSPEKVSGAHRVADLLADAGGHEPVVLSGSEASARSYRPGPRATT